MGNIYSIVFRSVDQDINHKYVGCDLHKAFEYPVSFGGVQFNYIVYFSGDDTMRWCHEACAIGMIFIPLLAKQF